MQKINLFWFRRDLRLHDNAGFYEALKEGTPVLPLFIFDRSILDELPEHDARVEFIHDEIRKMKSKLRDEGSDILVRYGKPEEVWKSLLEEHEINAVYTNRDYEPYAKTRDEKIAKLLSEHDVEFNAYKDHVIFEKDEVLKGDGTPYTVFTPYKKTWLEKLKSKPDSEYFSYYFKPYPNEEYFDNLYKVDAEMELPSLKSMGFESTDIDIPSRTVEQKVIKQYDKQRNFPGVDGTSRLGIHFRFGTISIREKARKARVLNDTFLSELVWRDFYSKILDAFPHVVDGSFRSKYDGIEWRNNEEEFEAWKEGKTGYPIVDAGMRELNTTGYMHNRVRMVVASFLTKHLLIDWRWGEAYFAEKLLDFDLASNNGGWQWAAGSGTDAAPYFRIFNPYTQREKFDKDKKYVNKWIPELGSDDYPEPIVDHKEARERCLATYKKTLNAEE